MLTEILHLCDACSCQDFEIEHGNGRAGPDFWVALLWRRLSGGQTVPIQRCTVGARPAPSAPSLFIPCAEAALSDLRLHAVCGAAGGLLLAFSNSNDQGRGVQLHIDAGGGSAGGGGGRGGSAGRLWVLRPANASAGLSDTQLVLNGAEAPLAFRGDTLPPLPPAELRPSGAALGAPVYRVFAPPMSLGFVLLPASASSDFGCEPPR